MKFSELSAGSFFSLIPDDGEKYIKIVDHITTGYTWNAKTNKTCYLKFAPDQEVKILNNFKRDPLKEL